MSGDNDNPTTRSTLKLNVPLNQLDMDQAEPIDQPVSQSLDGAPNDSHDLDTRGTIEAPSFQHFFTPLTAEAVTQSLQTLSVATANSVDSRSISSLDTAACRHDVVTPPVGARGTITTASAGMATVSHSSSSSGGGGVTPELSPLFLASLRGSSSPSHSQVSVGSHAPALTSAVLSSVSHKYDLTPVTRNTSSDLYCDVGKDAIMPITPSSQEGYLHGEHLAFPSDFTSSSASHSIPPLQPVHHHHHPHLRPTLAQTSSSASGGIDPSFMNVRQAHQRVSGGGGGSGRGALLVAPGRDRDLNIPEPLQFPSRKYYSFTTRKQYEEACLQDGGLFMDDSDDDLYNRSDSDDEYPPAIGSRLTPYAPRSRPANFDIERVPEAELKRIFNKRDTNQVQAYPTAACDAENPSHLLSEIALDQRVPSLRMAHNLHGSTTSISYTDHDDEDSVLHLRDNDDASLSSRGSSLHLSAEEDMIRSSTTHQDDPKTDDIMDEEVFLLLQRKQRKRKQRKKEQRAVEWLQSVEADQNVLAEAASSKFLTGGNSPIAAFRRQPSPGSASIALSRQISSPSTLLSSPPK